MRPNFSRHNWSYFITALCISLFSSQSIAQLNCNATTGDSYNSVTGIQAWTFDHTGAAGNFSGNATTNGDGDGNADGDISSNSNAWGLYANSGGVANQSAIFDIPFVASDKINLDMDNGFVENGSTVGFSLQNASDENLLEFYFVGGGTSYTINGNAGPTPTSVGFTDEGLSLSLTLNTATEIAISITDLGTATTSTYTADLITAPSGQAIKKIRLFNANSGFNDPSNLFFNNLEVCQSITDADGDGWFSDVDCDDTNPAVNPAGVEQLFNELDDDCDPATLDYNSGIFEASVTLGETYLLDEANYGPGYYYAQDLGTYYCEDTFFLQGAECKTFKCTSNENADIISAALHYRIYPIIEQPSGSFTTINLPFASDDGINFGCQDQTWRVENLGIDLLQGLDNAGYILEVYTSAEYTFTNGSGTHTSYEEQNYGIANFTVATDVVEPVAVCQDFNLVMGQDGIGILEIDDINNGSTDNCGIGSMALSQSTFTCEDLPTEPFTTDKLIISEYVCQSNFDNYIELFNGTLNPIDLSNYELRVYVGSQLTPIATDNLGGAGILAPNETAVFGRSVPGIYTGSKTILTNNSIAFQGQETVELFNNATNERVDIFGAIGEYPSPGWIVGGNSAIQHTLRRLPSVTEGNVAGLAGFPTLGTEWEQFPQGDISGLGSHDFDFNTGDPSLGIKLFVTDEFGNVGVCTSNVTFEIPLPAATCTDIAVSLDENGEATISAEDLNDGSTASCSSHTMSISQSTFDCSDIGDHIVTLTVTDIDGFESTCDATVTIEDNTLPNAICQNITVALDETGNATITAEDIDNGSNDACGISSVLASPLTFDINNVGANTVTLTVTDNNGNTSTCDATVTITGNVAPVAVCSDFTLPLDIYGEGTLEASDIDGGSSALAGIASYSVSQTSFTCSSIGENTVTLTVTDNNGLISTCEATVNVVDLVVPNAICKDATVTMGLDGTASLSFGDINNGSGDNCSLVGFDISQTEFSCGDIPSVEPSGELIISEYIHGSITNSNGVFIINNYIEVYNGTPFPVDFANYEMRRYIDNNLTPYTNDPLGEAGIIEPGEAFVFSQLFGTTYEGEQLELTEFTMIYNGSMPVELFNTTTGQTVDLIGAIGETPVDGWEVNGISTKHHTLRRLPNITQGVTESVPGFPTLGTQWEQFPLDEMSGLGSHESSASLEPSFSVILTIYDESGNSSSCGSNVTFEYEAPQLTCTNTTLYLDETGNVVLDASDLSNDIATGCGVDTLIFSQSEFDCSDIGDTQVTLTVVDVYENSSNCTSTVTIADNLAPAAICQDLTVDLDENGTASITVDQINNGSSDNCGILTISASQLTFGYTDIGDNTVTLTVTDVNGNTSTCESTVTVNGIVLPEAICINTMVDLDENGNATISGSDIDGGSSAALGISTLTASPSNFDCSQIGDNTVTLTVTDINGNVATCESIVTVTDNTLPTAVCRDFTLTLDEYGVGTLNPEDINDGSFDNCGMAGPVTASQIYFDCTHIGDNEVTLTVFDINGNMNTCQATVNVVGDIAPVAVCTNTTVFLDENGLASITAQDIGSGSSALCGLGSVTASQTEFSCSHLGENTVTLTVTDIHGNSSTCEAIVTVADNTLPIAVCQDVVVQLDENGEATITAQDVDGGSSDNCGIANMSLDQTTFDCNDMGGSNNTVYANDLFISEYVEGSGNNKYIEIYNGTGLDVDLSNYSLKLFSNGNSSANSTSTLGDAGVLASGEVAVFRNSSASIYSGTTYVVSAITFNGDDAIALYNGFDVVDIFGEIGSDPGSNWNVNGNVTSEHSLRRNADVTEGNIANTAGFPKLGTEWSTASQNDVSDLGQHTSDAGAETSGESIIVTLTVTDQAGNESSCTANVTIEDNTTPTTVCQDITVYLDANGEATITADDVDGGSSDNCGDVSLSIDKDTFYCTDIASESTGDQVWINEFHYDNSSSDVNEFIEVVANFDASNYQIDLYNGNGGSVYNTYSMGAAASSGNGYNFYLLSLAVNDIQNGPDGIALSDGNGNLIEFISYGGAFTGNGGTADGVTSTDVGVSESSAQIGESLQRIGNGAQGSSFTWVGPAADSPGTINENQSIGSGIATTVELTSIDAFGNSSTCTATVTVIDNMAPNVVCQNLTVNLDENGLASISAEDIDNGSSDNCEIETVEIDIDSFDCSNLGVVDVTLTATDINGNSANCTAQVTVVENTNPEAICQEITVELGADGTASITPGLINNGSYDNCGISDMTLSQSTFSCADLPLDGPGVGNQVWINEIHYDNDGADSNEGVEIAANFDVSGYGVFAYNGSNGTYYQGNTIVLGGATSEFAFYFLPMPGLQNGAPDGLALIDDEGNVIEFISYEGSFTATDFVANGMTSTDIGVSETGTTPVGYSLQLTGTGQTRSDFTWTIAASSTFGAVNNNQTFESTNSGVSVNLTVIDNSGNQSTCAANVNVVDLLAPDVVCQNISISLDENGTATITPEDIDGASTDNCSSELTLSISNSIFTCGNLGDNTVFLFAADQSGNEALCPSVVTVIDALPPTAICQNITVELDESGIASITAEDINNGSFDNCGIVAMSLDNYSFDCNQTGINFVTLTVTDPSGNNSTCTATVEILESVAPTALCQNATIYLDENGEANLTTSNIDNGSFDNCGTVSLALSQNQFDCSHAGENNVELTVSDNNGNQSSCTAVVTVIDMIVPSVICQIIDVALDENNMATITVDDIDAGSTDNCGIAARTISQSTFDCSHMGENVVTLSITDVNGNTSACDAIVNIIDPIAPTAICQGALVVLDANGEATLEISQINNGSYDNCGVANITLSQTQFDCSNFGGNTVTMTVTDIYGNSSSCDANVTVIDNIAPNAIGQNLIISLDENGEATVTAADLNNGSYDNCGIASISINQSNFDCSDLGANTVIMTASDIFGNSNTFLATVTVVDDLAPVLTCQNLSIGLDVSGYAEVSASDLVSSYSDNCSTVSLEITNGQTYFGCDDEGMTFEIEITATDENGNESTCSSNVSILTSLDSDADGISDVCDFCFGDNSLGDADGDGICDSFEICPGSEDLVDPYAECDLNTTMSSSSFQANDGGIYCISGPFAGEQITVSNGSTVRLSGSGNISVNVQYNSTLEVMGGSDIVFNSINVNWGANAMVVHSDAEVLYNGNFSPNGTVVNCGTITAKQLTVNYAKTFINNNTVETTDVKLTNSISGDLINYGLIHTAGSMTLTWNGEIFNHCHIDVDRNMSVERHVRNYAFIEVGVKTTISYNGRVHQYDGAMFQSESTNVQGRYVGYGALNFLKILGNTTMSWNGKFEGSLAVCDLDGFENVSSPNPFINGAYEDCNLDIAVSECNPVGHEAIPHELGIAGTPDTDSNDHSGESTLDNIPSLGFENMNGQHSNEINIWPNPTNGKATLMFTPVSNERVKIQLYAIDGSHVKTIFEGDVNRGVSHTERIDMSNYENGVYFIRLVQNENVQTKKIVFTR